MNTDDIEMGPIDYVAGRVARQQPEGEIAPYLVDLVDRGLIRISTSPSWRRVRMGPSRRWSSPISARRRRADDLRGRRHRAARRRGSRRGRRGARAGRLGALLVYETPGRRRRDRRPPLRRSARGRWPDPDRRRARALDAVEAAAKKERNDAKIAQDRRSHRRDRRDRDRRQRRVQRRQANKWSQQGSRPGPARSGPAQVAAVPPLPRPPMIGINSRSSRTEEQGVLTAGRVRRPEGEATGR